MMTSIRNLEMKVEEIQNQIKKQTEIPKTGKYFNKTGYRKR